MARMQFIVPRDKEIGAIEGHELLPLQCHALLVNQMEE
jgi:hypothetical protein